MTSKSPYEILASAQSGRFVVQEFRPLSSSIEWELSRLYYQRYGSRVFLTNNDHVPFAITNDGNLSASAARLVFESAVAAETAGTLRERINVLELGIGSGLFARYFLHVFRDLCDKSHRDYYERLCYIGGDRSIRMLNDVKANSVLAEHDSHVYLQCFDALDPLTGLKQEEILRKTEGHPFTAIICNYLLDVLPATILKTDGSSVSEVCVRTCLARDVDLEKHTSLSKDEIALRATSNDITAREELINLYPLFALEFDYRAVDTSHLPYCEDAIELAELHDGYVLHNYGAFQCIDRLRSILHHEGFVLISDYGGAAGTDALQLGLHQRFSGTVAIGLNFDLLKCVCERQFGLECVTPDEDNAYLTTRLLAQKPSVDLVGHFHREFDKCRIDALHQSTSQARQHLEAGRNEQALAAFSEAIRLQPFSWILRDEAASFLTLTLRDFEAGRKMAQSGLDLNPTCSASLWNSLGDSLYCLKRYEDARLSFEKALQIDPDNVRARFNLAYYFQEVHDCESALRVVSEALLLDRTGEFTERLLHKQADVVRQLMDIRQNELMMLQDRISPTIDTNVDAAE